MNGKRVFMCIVCTIITIALIASLFFDEWTRAAILFGVLCLGFIAYHITGFLLIHEIEKGKGITIVFNKYAKTEQDDEQMTLDEAIEHCRDRENCSKCGQEHKQLREWLEELKERRAKDEPMTIDRVCKEFGISDIGEFSDGYHTFNSLYHQRAVLFATIVNQNKDRGWKSRKHSDGESCFGGGWFIVGVDTPEGSYTYHYEDKSGICLNVSSSHAVNRGMAIQRKMLRDFLAWRIKMRLVKDIQTRVVRCPACGKRPKVSISGGCAMGWYCRIECKPLFRKAHLDIESGKASLEHAVSTAVDIWNEEASECEREVLLNELAD